MTVVAAKKDVFEKLGDFLDLRIGMIFEKGKGPKNAEGMLRHPSTEGSRWEKFYFPPTGADLLKDGFTLKCPSSMKGALFGELLLKAVGSFNKRHVSQRVSFGRFGEERPFEFNEDTSYISLRISRPEEGEFKALYIRHKLKEKEGDYEYFVLMVRWDDDSIALRVFTRTVEQVPPHLV